jgi:hypothetical protein
VRELCPDCGANVRGPGINVPHNQVPDVDALPVWKIVKRVPEDKQGWLF